MGNDNKMKNSANNKKDEKSKSKNEKREPNSEGAKAVFSINDRSAENKK